MKKTKIVCTIGPASETVETLVKLMNAGMNVARLNFSHGDFEEHGARISNIREAAKITGKTIALLLDTKGPEIRTNNMKDGKVELSTGDTVRISMTEVEGTKEKFSITYPELINDVVVGNHILLDDGLIDLEVLELDKENNEIVTKVLNEGTLKNKKGVNVPNVSINLPGITEKDEADIRFGIQNDVDFIAASFVRRPSDVLEITKILEDENATHIQIVSKIENQEGIDNLDDILKVSDGLMVARGDLGVEIPTEDVPVVQKEMIKKCNALGKPVITATQMLDSMQHNPRPTRAEASDVANAIYDGTDAIMLSGETAAGDYPVESVQTMTKIANAIEPMIPYKDRLKANVKSSKRTLNDAIGISVADTALAIDIKCIVAFTQSGNTARRLAKFRPCAPILAVTFDEVTQRSLLPVNGVTPVVSNIQNNKENDIDLARNLALQAGFKTGDHIIVVAGYPIGSGNTNMMRIAQI